MKEGTLPFYVFGAGGALNTFSKSEAEKWDYPVQEIIELPVVTLKSIVERYCPNGFPDFLDCDIEGLDFEVLSDYDLAGNGPKVICVEVRSEDIVKFDEMLRQKGISDFAGWLQIIFMCRISIVKSYVRLSYKLNHLQFK